ncbi:MAG: BamA/TamA family outer membrane protein, partial [Planctomycetaceae bacterium]|nr:BamA/TamA family outer membrane protein [Planctomycetaceae bacterium]
GAFRGQSPEVNSPESYIEGLLGERREAVRETTAATTAGFPSAPAATPATEPRRVRTGNTTPTSGRMNTIPQSYEPPRRVRPRPLPQQQVPQRPMSHRRARPTAGPTTLTYPGGSMVPPAQHQTSLVSHSQTGGTGQPNGNPVVPADYRSAVLGSGTPAQAYPSSVVRAQNEEIRGQNQENGIPQAQDFLFDNSPQGDPFSQALRAAPGQIDLTYEVSEARTGRLMFGVGVNSDSGVVGSIVLDERNFDITRPPTSLSDVLNGTAWRGAGQRFRLEAVPGSQVSRYMASWTDPYFLDTNFSLGLSGFFYSRFFEDWDEERAGGRVTVGRQWSPEISTSLAVRLEDVTVDNPSTLAAPLLAEAVGSNLLSTVRVSASHDTRDMPFLPGAGHYIQAGLEQAFGDFSYPRVDVSADQYFTAYARPDGGGRHIISLSGNVAWTGDDTPIFERYFAGGFQTFRGFEFRGVSPRQAGVRVGGEFMALGTLQYTFPITASEMLQGVVFTDFGTVEDQAGFDDFRATAGGGIRITVPAMGPVPLAFDWAVPIAKTDDDDTRMFSFYIGMNR